MSDAELLRQFVEDRSEEAFRGLVERFLPLVLGVARRRLGNDDDARDVAQQVFALLARKASSLREAKSLPAWLHAVAVNESMHFVRSEATRRRHLNEFTRAMEVENQAPESTAWQRVLPQLNEAMLRLSDPDREALVLRFFDGCSFREMGGRLGPLHGRPRSVIQGNGTAVWVSFCQSGSKRMPRLPRHGCRQVTP
ncbi:MAG: RNA polymerase sigma factor [Verrucomicrobiales bacterium]